MSILSSFLSIFAPPAPSMADCMAGDALEYPGLDKLPLHEFSEVIDGEDVTVVVMDYAPEEPARLDGHPDDRHPGAPAEVEWELLVDGRPAPHVQAQLSDAEWRRIEAQIYAARRVA